MRYLNQINYESFIQLLKEFREIEQELNYICIDKEHLNKCLKELREEVREVMQ